MKIIFEESKMKIVIAGATGLVGSNVLTKLMKNTNHQVISLTRKKIALDSPHQSIILDWDQWVPEAFAADVFICTLGTTIKVAGSKANFKKVDFDYVKKFAEAAKKSNAKKFIIVSANGADKNSTFFYNQVKGETEEMLQGYQFNSLAILRPSLLIGPREELRVFEKCAQSVLPWLDFMWQGPFKKYQTIKATQVADKIIQLIDLDWRGDLILESDKIKE